MLLKKYEDMSDQLLEKDKLINKKMRECEMLKSINLSLEKQHVILENKLSKLEAKYQKIKNDYGELFLEYGRLSVENDSKANKMKTIEQFQRIFLPKSLASSVVNIKGKNSRHSVSMPNVPSSSSSSLSAQQSAGAGGESPRVSASNSKNNYEENGGHLNTGNERNLFSEQLRLSIDVVERDNGEPISLINQPCSSVPADVYNAYKLLLLTISDRLLYEDIIKVQEWADEKFAVQTNLNPYDVFMELDKKGAITALDLSQLGVFFESIVRHDLVHLIHEFKNGDYDKLKKLVFQTKSRNKSGKWVCSSSQVRVRLANDNTLVSSQRPMTNALVSNAYVDVGNAQVLEKSRTAEGNNPTSVGCDHQDSRSFGSNFLGRSSSRIQGGLSMHGDSENVLNVSAVTKSRGWWYNSSIIFACLCIKKNLDVDMNDI